MSLVNIDGDDSFVVSKGRSFMVQRESELMLIYISDGIWNMHGLQWGRW